jgi:hypothetical protein
MPECNATTERMPLLLTESLDPDTRELTHQHIETCAVCADEWSAFQEAWRLMGDLPDYDVPPRVKEQFLMRAGIAPAQQPAGNVVPFHRRKAFKWVAQAAAVVVLAGGGFFAGHRQPATLAPTPATVTAAGPYDRVGYSNRIMPMALAETRVLDADNLSPEIQGRPNITNVQCVDCDASDGQIGVSFDISSRWTVTGNPKDKSMLRLLSYMIENEESTTPRSTTMEWVRRMYSDPAFADPQIANAMAKVLRSDEHEGVRIRAVETLRNFPPEVATQTRDALIEALKSDPNPAVRLKAVEALANMIRKGEVLDTATLDTLRQKASQGDENLYVRVKAAEALGSIKP